MLESIVSRYKKDNVYVAGHLLNNVGKDYASVVTGLEASRKTKDVEAIQDAFERHWKKYKTSGSGNGLGEETLLKEGSLLDCVTTAKKNRPQMG